MPFDPMPQNDILTAPHYWDAAESTRSKPVNTGAKRKVNYVWQAVLVSVVFHVLLLMAFAAQKIKSLTLVPEQAVPTVVVPITLYERAVAPKVAAPSPPKVAEPVKADPLQPKPRVVESVAPTAVTQPLAPTKPISATEVAPVETKTVTDAAPQAQTVSKPAYDLGGYYNRVASKLNRAKSYPFEARQKKVTGTVKIAFVIHRDGHISGVRVAQSSGSDLLDQAALKALEKSAPFETLPLEANKDSVPMVWACHFTLK